jgi:hypothetical protein
MKKLLFISEHLPFGFSGFRRIYHELKLFSKDFEVHFIRLKINDKQDRLALDIPTDVEFTQINCAGMRFDALFLLYPVYMPQMQKMAWAKPQMQKYVDENNIDVIIFNTPSVALALRDIKAPTKVVEMIDSPQLYYRTKMEHLPSLNNKLIYMINRLFCKEILAEFDMKFDLFVYLTEQDKNEDGMSEEKTFVSMEGRDEPFRQFSGKERSIDVLMLGNWKHPPNRDGLKEVLPKLEDINGGVIIIGDGIDWETKYPFNVSPVGFMDDLDDYMFRSKIVLIPVFYGSGLQNKVFDALRHGCKVITTPFTKKKLEDSGFVSNSVVASNDIVKETNVALQYWWNEDAIEAYRSYWKWQKIDAEKQAQYADAIKRAMKKKEAKI